MAEKIEGLGHGADFVPMKREASGRKDDGFGTPSQKARFDLLPPLSELEEAWVLTHGAIHYGPNNWKLVEDHVARYAGALRRHFNLYMQGQFLDPDTNLAHLAHIKACCDFLMEARLAQISPDAGSRYHESPAYKRKQGATK